MSLWSHCQKICQRKEKGDVIGLLSKLFSIQVCFYRIAISICLSFNRYQDHFTLTMVPMKLMLFPFSSSSPPFHSHFVLFSLLSSYLLFMPAFSSFTSFPSCIFSFAEYFFQIFFSAFFIQPLFNFTLSTKGKDIINFLLTNVLEIKICVKQIPHDTYLIHSQMCKWLSSYIWIMTYVMIKSFQIKCVLHLPSFLQKKKVIIYRLI